jgi:hypothetical protein
VSIGFVSRRMALLSILVLGSSGLLFGAAKSGMLGKKELKSLIAGAKTAEQHRRIAGHYRAQAKALCEEAVEHEEMAAVYEKAPTLYEQKFPMSGTTAGHCRYFAEASRKAADEADALAVIHEEMAKSVK